MLTRNELILGKINLFPVQGISWTYTCIYNFFFLLSYLKRLVKIHSSFSSPRCGEVSAVWFNDEETVDAAGEAGHRNSMTRRVLSVLRPKAAFWLHTTLVMTCMSFHRCNLSSLPILFNLQHFLVAG